MSGTRSLKKELGVLRVNSIHRAVFIDLRSVFPAACLTLLLGTVSSEAQAQAAPDDDPVLHWNGIALQADADDHSGTWRRTDDGRPAPEQGGPTAGSRALAIVHLAIYDAVNAIDGTHDPYLRVDLALGLLAAASIDAAVARAAHDTLVALYPSQRTVFDEALTAALNDIPGGARHTGEEVGALTAENILAARAHDGSDGPMPYTPGTEPGDHRPDPLHPEQGFLGSGWGMVDSFSGIDVTDPFFRAPPPPALDSPEYAEAFAEVKDFGGDGQSTATLRDATQTDIGIFWAYDGTIGLGVPPRIYNQAVRTIAALHDNTVVENARLFALVNLAMADAGIACWESKYFYNLWRPVVGIRTAGTDGNDETHEDAAWMPLGAPASNRSGTDFTPPFPSYPSGHATFGGSTFRMLERFYGSDEMTFQLASDEMNGTSTDWAGNPRHVVVRDFDRFSAAALENAQSRIYLGIHWQFDATAGVDQGAAIADHVFDNMLQKQAEEPPPPRSSGGGGGLGLLAPLGLALLLFRTRKWGHS